MEEQKEGVPAGGSASPDNSFAVPRPFVVPGESAVPPAEPVKIMVSRRLLKISALALSVLLIAAAVFAVRLYRRISATRQVFDEAVRESSPPSPVKMEPVGDPGVSGLGLFSSGGSAPSSLIISPDSSASAGPQGMGTAEAVKTYAALAKYYDRPIVKEFIAELKKDPSFKQALADSGGDNPLKVFSGIQNIKGMDKTVKKFAFRPEFLKVVMEVMADPELKPLLRGMPGIPAAGLPFPVAAADESASEPPDSGDEIGLDQTVINGGASARSGAIKRTAPPPIDE